MKRIAIFGLGLMLLLAAGCGRTRVDIRPALRQPVTLAFVDAPIMKILQEIGRQCAVPVECQIEQPRRMTVYVDAVPAEAVLPWLVAEAGLSSEFGDGRVVVTLGPKRPAPPKGGTKLLYDVASIWGRPSDLPGVQFDWHGGPEAPSDREVAGVLARHLPAAGALSAAAGKLVLRADDAGHKELQALLEAFPRYRAIHRFRQKTAAPVWLHLRGASSAETLQFLMRAAGLTPAHDLAPGGEWDRPLGQVGPFRRLPLWQALLEVSRSAGLAFRVEKTLSLRFRVVREFQGPVTEERGE